MLGSDPYTRRVDIRRDNPVGRVPDTRSTRRQTLQLSSAGWSLGRHSGPWTLAGIDDVVRRLDTAHALHWTGALLPLHAPLFAELAHRAVARGTFVSGALDEAVTAHLPESLARSIAPAPHPGEVGDLAWDVAAVNQRRAALQPLIGPTPSMSAVLVSQRPELIIPMVRQLAALHYDKLEIVVASHGAPLPDGLQTAAGERPVVARELDSALVFGDALNQAFAMASGDLVSKVDDDDYYGYHHLWDLAATHTYSGATLVGKTTTVVYLEALDTTVRRVFGARETFTHRIAGGTMTLSAQDLRAVGGWPAVPRGVDTALLRSVREASGTVYQPHDIGYLYVRGHDHQAHTWTADVGHFLRNVREQWIGLLQHAAFGTDVNSDGAPSR